MFGKARVAEKIAVVVVALFFTARAEEQDVIEASGQRYGD